MRLFGLLLGVTALLPAQIVDMNSLMARVAAHQDEAQHLREQYTYVQKVKMRALYSHGKLAREEDCSYRVTPKEKSSDKELIDFRGRYTYKGQLVEYKKPGEENPHRKVDIDASVVPSIRDSMVNDKESKDGIGKDLFPMTSAEVTKYKFTLAGRRTFKGRPVYDITFQPKKDHAGWDDDDTVWSGEALIDEQDEQAVWVETHMTRGIPFWVKTVLGTDIRQLGFTVSYVRLDSGVYFASTYGGEFFVSAVFFYKRTFTISLENSDFKRVHTDSTIRYEAAQ